MRGMQFSLGPVCIWLQLNLIDMTPELLWAVCMCVHTRVWLARQYGCKHGRWCGVGNVLTVSGLKHNQRRPPFRAPGKAQWNEGTMSIVTVKSFSISVQWPRDQISTTTK